MRRCDKKKQSSGLFIGNEDGQGRRGIYEKGFMARSFILPFKALRFFPGMFLWRALTSVVTIAILPLKLIFDIVSDISLFGTLVWGFILVAVTSTCIESHPYVVYGAYILSFIAWFWMERWTLLGIWLNIFEPVAVLYRWLIYSIPFVNAVYFEIKDRLFIDDFGYGVWWNRRYGFPFDYPTYDAQVYFMNFHLYREEKEFNEYMTEEWEKGNRRVHFFRGLGAGGGI